MAVIDDLKTKRPPRKPAPGDEIPFVQPGEQLKQQAPLPHMETIKPAETDAQTEQRWAQTPFNPQSLGEIVDRYSKPKQLTPEELEQEQKREQTKARITAVADAISAIGEMAAVTKGAVPSTLPNLSGSAMQRYQQRLDMRQKEQDAYRGKLEQAAMTDFAQKQKADLANQQRVWEFEQDEVAWRRKAEEAKKNRDWEAQQNANRQAETARLQRERLDQAASEGKANRALQYSRANASNNRPAPVDKRVQQVRNLGLQIERADIEIAELQKGRDPDKRDKIKAATDRKEKAQREMWVTQKEMEADTPAPQPAAATDEVDEFDFPAADFPLYDNYYDGTAEQ